MIGCVEGRTPFDRIEPDDFLLELLDLAFSTITHSFRA
jgi:hypothetical protein